MGLYLSPGSRLEDFDVEVQLDDVPLKPRSTSSRPPKDQSKKLDSSPMFGWLSSEATKPYTLNPKPPLSHWRP